MPARRRRYGVAWLAMRCRVSGWRAWRWIAGCKGRDLADSFWHVANGRIAPSWSKEVRTCFCKCAPRDYQELSPTAAPASRPPVATHGPVSVAKFHSLIQPCLSDPRAATTSRWSPICVIAGLLEKLIPEGGCHSEQLPHDLSASPPQSKNRPIVSISSTSKRPGAQEAAAGFPCQITGLPLRDCAPDHRSQTKDVSVQVPR